MTFLTLIPLPLLPCAFLVLTPVLTLSSHLIHWIPTSLYSLSFFLWFPLTTSFIYCFQFPFSLPPAPPACQLSISYSSTPSSNILLYSFSFFTSREGFLPTSIIKSGAHCSSSLSTEVLLSVYYIIKERNLTVFSVMKPLPCDTIGLRKLSVGCLGDICRCYSNCRIGELPLCFFVFLSMQVRTHPRWYFCVSRWKEFGLYSSEDINEKSDFLKLWSYSCGDYIFLKFFDYRVTWAK